MKSRSLVYVYLLVVALSVAIAGGGCAESPVSRCIARSLSLVETSPDSVRILLDSIDTQDLSREDEARYALLDAQSRHKLYMPMPSDSALNLAADWFGSHGPDSLMMKTLFYRGVTAADAGRIEDATRDAVAAWEMADGSKNYYWKGKTAELVADLAGQIQNYQEELRWRKVAAESYRNAGRTENYLYSLCDVSSSYLNLRDSLNACNLDDSVGKLIRRYPDNSPLQLYHASRSMYICNSFGDMGRMDSLYDLLRDVDVAGDGRKGISLIKANMLLNAGDYLGCRNLLDSLDSVLHTVEHRSWLYDLYYRLSKQTGDFDLMKESTDSLLSIQSDLIADALQQPVTATQRDFFRTEVGVKEVARKKAAAAGVTIALCSVVLVFAGVTLYRWHIRRKNRILKEKVARILEVSTQLEEQTVKNREIREELDSLKVIQEGLQEVISSAEEKDNEDAAVIRRQRAELRKRTIELRNIASVMTQRTDMMREIYTGQWEIINRLCREMVGEDKFDKVKWINIRKELDKMKTDTFYKEIERKLDLYTDGMIGMLREECPMLSEHEIRLAVYLAAGFSVAAIHFMTGAPDSTIYSRRNAIIKKIEKGNPAGKDRFLTALRRS